MQPPRFFPACFRFLAALGSLLAPAALGCLAQETVSKPAEKAEETRQENSPASAAPELPAVIELLETSIRFEADGASRKEVHTRVHINSELGVRQFARLNFDYNRAFETVEIPFVRITHASGGTADILPGAITDQPNPAVVNAPAYQVVRTKSVRILGLAPSDTLEYRIITTVLHHPLSPDFSLEHSFDRTGVVAREIFEVDLPASLAPSAPVVVRNEQMKVALASRLSEVVRVWTTHPDRPRIPSLKASEELPPRVFPKVEVFVKPSTPAATIKKTGVGEEARVSYSWHRTARSLEADGNHASPVLEDMADVELGLAATWLELSHQLYAALRTPGPLPQEVIDRSQQLTQGAESNIEKTERIYDFVSKKIRTIDLPLGATGFHPRLIGEILSSGYASPEDKFSLFEALAKVADLGTAAVLIGPARKIGVLVVRPSAFTHLVVWVSASDSWLDPSLEVAPFRSLPASYLGSSALFLGPPEEIHDVNSLVWTAIPRRLPFASSQKVTVEGSVDSRGQLTARVNYRMRGENELLLRVAFHQAPQEKWMELAQLLSLSDGFRGKVSSVTASDPYATREPFTLEYEISMPRFLDWSKKPVRIPALLPQLGLPDPPAKPAAGGPPSPIELGTPLEVETRATVHLPPATTVHTPVGTTVERDYATFTSRYSAMGPTITASRQINFLLMEVPAERAVDYNAFLHAVQNDEAQDFTLERPDLATGKTAPAAEKPATAKPPF